ncbi:chitinase [Kitasatospora sp. GP82]|uniref:chitinase n=1 Tax=Kitasatospora sp. GP82 TaxID=3035089 RepID=UPI002473670B|nr:chitinase [Kitasatospora sp. GP82]MDH6126770.1 chitinase [Kitasatospora sp. GP82]
MLRPLRLTSALAPLALTAGTLLAAAPPAQAAAIPGPGFPAHYTAPYIETWRSGASLTEANRATGLKYFTLAFVISNGSCNGAFDGTVPVENKDWQSAVNALRAGGGDVITSFGGGAGAELALVCNSVDSLKAEYRRVVDTLNLTRIDFDIEGPTLDNAPAVDRRNQALAELQREYAAAGRRLGVHYTLPVNPYGLSPNAVRLLENARDRGLDVSVVNIMTMDYGPELDMGKTATTAAAELHKQMARIWPEKTPQQLWGMQGNTPMIGVNDATNEIFSTKDATTLTDFATAKGIQLLAYWSLGRDRACPTDGSLSEGCSGTPQNQHEFARILNRPTQPERTVPDWWSPRCTNQTAWTCVWQPVFERLDQTGAPAAVPLVGRFRPMA